ncbi:MAG: DUF2442 domain-containing protein [Polyangiaceae bacterium]
MLPHIVNAELVNAYRIRLTFSDGASGIVDFEKRIVGRGGVFLALEDPEVFGAFSLDAEAGTIIWPNGVDFCPNTLHEVVTGQGSVAA